MLVLCVNFAVKCLKTAPKWSLFYFQPILVAIFVTIATVKVKLIPDFYTWAIVLINLYKDFAEKQILFFSLTRGPKYPTNARTSFRPLDTTARAFIGNF